MPISIQKASKLYEEYQKYTILHKEYLNNLKETVTEIIIKKHLVSCMNTTKWLKLQLAVEGLSFPPAYIARYVTDKEDDTHVIQGQESLSKEPPGWVGNWLNYYDEGMPPLFNIEWIKVRPQLVKSKGKLIKPDIIDETNNFREILKSLYIPYEEKENIFTIYGYRVSFS